MTKLRRYTPEEDSLILRDWWDPEKREGIMDSLERTKGSIDFRYYSLLKEYGIDPGDHRNNRGVLPNNLEDHREVSPLLAEINELKEELENIYISIAENGRLLRTYRQELKAIRRIMYNQLEPKQEEPVTRERLLRMNLDKKEEKDLSRL